MMRETKEQKAFRKRTIDLQRAVEYAASNASKIAKELEDAREHLDQCTRILQRHLENSPFKPTGN